MTSIPISEEVNDDDHETSDQVVTEPRRSTRVSSAPEWYGNPVMEVMLLSFGAHHMSVLVDHTIGLVVC